MSKVAFFPNRTSGAENATSIVFLPQIVLGTILSVQMDLAGQHRVQVVGHIPSGSVKLCHCLFFFLMSLANDLFFLHVFQNHCFPFYFVQYFWWPIFVRNAHDICNCIVIYFVYTSTVKSPILLLS